MQHTIEYIGNWWIGLDLGWQIIFVLSFYAIFFAGKAIDVIHDLFKHEL